MSNTFDLIIRGGMVFDGSGAAGFAADVAVSDDRIAAVGGLSAANAAKTIDATGCVVCPGFIDIHSHGDVLPLLCPTADGKVLDGVTTEIIGNCGMSPFPQSPEVVARRCDNPDHQIQPSWTCFEEFAARQEEIGTSINRGILVGHGNLRRCVAGDNGRALSADEHRRMARLLRRSLDAGALGMSSGLIYPPGCFSTRAEMLPLCRIVREYDAIYSTHVRSEGDALEAAISECCDVAAEAGARLQISHLKTGGKRNWHKIEWLLNELERRLEAGVDLAVDRYPYVASCTDLDALLPTWAVEGGAEAELARLADPDIRARMIPSHWDADYWRRVMVSSISTDANKHLEGKTIAEIAQARGCEPADALFDIILEERTKVSTILFSMCEENLERILRFRMTAIGSDASVRAVNGPTAIGKPHPRAFGTFARLLGVYVRERGALDLPTAVHRMTGLPARRLRLKDRGAVRCGSFADVTVFDPEAIIDNATFADPCQYSSGVVHVVVNGVHTVADGRHTKKLGGRLLRR
ncbi:MAG: D-aminoacylase [Planctomycetes bacterium]|nr:D-aminoacylase [Planctomycetota bacterium]